MLTINYNGKTYIPKLSYIDLLDSKAFENCIKQGYLEEVKVKPLSQKRADAIERGKEVTIIEKLREELERIINSEKTKERFTILTELEELLDLLTSLEQPKEEPQPQEDIELLSFTEGYTVLTEYLELLTNAVNQLIKANKK